MVFVGIIPRASFLCKATDWFSSPINRSALGKKHWERGWVSRDVNKEVGKAVATVRKKNTQAEVKYRKIRISCQQKRCFI